MPSALVFLLDTLQLAGSLPLLRQPWKRKLIDTSTIAYCLSAFGSRLMFVGSLLGKKGRVAIFVIVLILAHLYKLAQVNQSKIGGLPLSLVKVCNQARKYERTSRVVIVARNWRKKYQHFSITRSKTSSTPFRCGPKQCNGIGSARYADFPTATVTSLATRLPDRNDSLFSLSEKELQIFKGWFRTRSRLHNSGGYPWHKDRLQSRSGFGKFIDGLKILIKLDRLRNGLSYCLVGGKI